ncbi:MAG: TonB-dependent receptor plug domain-containing protein [Candidatus Latescibacteria bacterium]|nr:TonB-dependent receptor plug domain-containing protein [Candidatus Latescibacterota bacterium]
MQNSRIRFLSCLLFLSAAALLTGTGGAWAQSQATTGVIRGFVWDQFSNPIGNATIVLTETGTNYERTLTSSEVGLFTATLLPLGSYDVQVQATGQTEVRQTGIQVRVGATVELIVKMVPQMEEMVVEADLPTVDITQSEPATRLSEEAVQDLPNNGRNFLNLTLLTPGVAIVQGPDGDELSIAGQRGIHNNVSVDGADFNNPFFGEQRGGQRPAFTFNLDAVEEIVVVPQGANAEFGRSSGGFVNVITKSGTNEFHGSAHFFGKNDALSSTAKHKGLEREPDFTQGQIGFTLGGPLVKDKAFFFTAYDQQVFEDTKQNDSARIDPRLRDFMDTQFNGVLAGDYGPIDRTNDARAFLAKVDYRLSDNHYATFKYNYTWSEQENGTFDVDSWARSANAVEEDWSHAFNGSLMSVLSSTLTNEFRFQFSREDRPRSYGGPDNPATGRPFPDTGMDFVGGYRFGLPFFIPVDYYDTRIQLLNNLTVTKGNHLIKAGAEWNRVESVQTFIGFANGRVIFSSVDGFLNYVENGNGYVECSDGSTSTDGACPEGASITGPIELYLQQAGVGGLSVEEAGTQEIPQHELALFVQDSWQPSNKLTVNYGLRWEAQIQPDVITDPEEVFYADFIGKTVTNDTGTYEFPSDGEIPSDMDMLQPRLGLAYDLEGDNKTLLRASAGVYYARIPGLNLAGTRSTNGSRGQTIFRNSAASPFLGPPPVYGELVPAPEGTPFGPDITVFDKDFENPRTISTHAGVERELHPWGLVGSFGYTYARTDNLTRFVNGNDAVFGRPWATGLGADGSNGIGNLTVVESTAKSRYHGVSFSLRQMVQEDLQFQVNYTLSWDKSSDDNERDPFTFRYVDASQLDREWGYSDRDQRHRLNVWALAKLPGDVFLSNRLSYYSAQPTSEACGEDNSGSGNASTNPWGPTSDRICGDGSIIERNTLRKDNEFFSWDVRLTRPIPVGNGQLEAIVEVFNLLNTDNFRDPSSAGLLFNFDGTVQSGLGDPREVQVGLRYAY